jgi:hypothetical protein
MIEIDWTEPFVSSLFPHKISRFSLQNHRLRTRYSQMQNNGLAKSTNHQFSDSPLSTAHISLFLMCIFHLSLSISFKRQSNCRRVELWTRIDHSLEVPRNVPENPVFDFASHSPSHIPWLTQSISTKRCFSFPAWFDWITIYRYDRIHMDTPRLFKTFFLHGWFGPGQFGWPIGKWNHFVFESTFSWSTVYRRRFLNQLVLFLASFAINCRHFRTSSLIYWRRRIECAISDHELWIIGVAKKVWSENWRGSKHKALNSNRFLLKSGV